jgi:pentatricopeptide repeat protein
MHTSGIQPDAQLYVPLLLGCANTLSLLEGEQVHNQIINNKIKMDTRLGNSLINMYGKCGQTNKAMDVLQQMEIMGVTRDAITWTTIIQILDSIDEGIRTHHQLMV